MGPIGAARVGYIDGEYILNPTDDAGRRRRARPRRRRHRQRRDDGRIRSQGAFGRGHARRGACSRTTRSQQVVNAIIDLAEKAAKDPWELADAGRQLGGQGQAQEADRQGHRRRLQADRQVGALERAQRRARQGQGRVRRRRPRRTRWPPASSSRSSRPTSSAARSSRTASASTAARHADVRPIEAMVALPAARPRLGAVHARRDAGDLHHARSAPRTPSR